jgi:hypothetical protein
MAPNRELSHARSLSVLWQDGVKWELRLDQGLSFMHAPRREDFPFSRPVPEQVVALRTRSFAIQRRDDASVHMYSRKMPK